MITKRQYLCPTVTILGVETMQMIATSDPYASKTLSLDNTEEDNDYRQARERKSWSDGSDAQDSEGSTDTWGGLW